MGWLTVAILSLLLLGDGSFSTVKTYPAPEAKQAVAADGQYFYAIDDAMVAKYDMQGQQVAKWQPEASSHIKHLNSGFIKGGKLYMAHSNYPVVPRVSSIEVLDTKTMKHLQTHNFGLYDGAASWVLWHRGNWWVLFAHYTGQNAEVGRTSADTRLERFDEMWNKLGSYYFPNDLVKKFQPKSLSGGAFGPDGYLYCTGHDEAEVYRLQVPETGDTMVHLATIPVVCEGQGIAWQGKRLYTIKRSTREVVVSEWTGK